MAIRQLAFLFGAGSSVEAGLPTAMSLTEYLASLSSRFPDAHATDIENLLRATQARLAHEQGVAASTLDFEAVLGTLAEIGSGQVSRPQSLFGEPDGVLRDFITSGILLDVVQRLFDIIRMVLDVDPEATTYLDSVMQLAPRARLDLFSLNYDLSLEAVLSRAGVRFVDGFERARTGSGLRLWDARVFDRPRARVRLFKLHGSVDWAFLKQPWAHDEQWSQARLTRYLENLPELARVKDWREAGFNLPGSQSGPVAALNLGTRKELLYASAPFAELFDRFRLSLESADACVVVGYSFRDQRVNQMIEDAAVHRRGGLRLLIVDPCANDLFERWPQLSKFTDQGVAAIEMANVGDSLRSGDCHRALRSLMKGTVGAETARWATSHFPITRTVDAEQLEPGQVWRDVRRHVDALLILQTRTWRDLGWTTNSRPAPDDPRLLARLHSLAVQVAGLRSIVDAAKLNQGLEVGPHALPTGNRDLQKGIAILADFPAYLSTLHFRLHEENHSPQRGQLLWHVANRVGTAFDDVEAVLTRALWHSGAPDPGDGNAHLGEAAL